MTTEQQRIAIAEACGWRGWYCTRCKEKVPNYQVTYDERHSDERECGGVCECCPEYTSDLNAMNEAESLLDSMSIDDQSKYLDYLYCCVGWDEANNAKEAKFKCHYGSVRATAAQRAEAFLRTIGKWRD